PMPSYEEIVKRMKENKEVLSTKIEQGFTKLLIVPFGVQINYLKMIYSNALLLHHARGKLFRTKKDPNEADVKLDLDKDNPFYTWDDLDREKLAYYPKKFDRNDHGGKTKEQLLAEEQTGWHILLIEDMPNIPRKKEDIKTVGGRVQIDNTASSMRSYIHIGEEFPSADEYLRGLQESPIYLHEQGFTPEDQIMYVLSYLEETSQVLDTASEGRPETLLLGAYSKSHGMVPTFYWSLLNNRTRIEKIFQQGRNWDFGIRTSVKI
ncbi:MAG: hypothetical protein U1A25_02080, partial [Candidatus Sungbacteria bacterium]|nr:hypothetical protein [Candidatus Sungbacteria bacterium]